MTDKDKNMKTYKLLYLLLLLPLLASCSASRNTTQAVDKRIQYAYRFIGTPYRTGGTTPQGFDCSGFMQYVFRNFDCNLPRSTADQVRVGKEIKRKKLMPGDLVFFAGRSGKSVGHVGMVVQTYPDKTFKFIHVATQRGVTEDYSHAAYWRRRYLIARRVFF